MSDFPKMVFTNDADKGSFPLNNGKHPGVSYRVVADAEALKVALAGSYRETLEVKAKVSKKKVSKKVK